MTTKYIVDNLSGQTINGDLTINGNLTVTGATSGLATYKALLTQTANLTSSNINGFYGAFIIGETYTIDTYVSGDDFSNIANVVSGTINTTGCEFIASGETPTNWDNGSTLTSSGNLVVTVLENTLGYDLYWEANLLGEPGSYFAINNTIESAIYNSFNRNNVSVTSQVSTLWAPSLILQYAGVGSYTAKDDIILLKVYDFDADSGVNNRLYYTPIQVDIKQDLDTTPIVLSGSVQSSFPFSYVSTGVRCNGVPVDGFVGDSNTVTNTEELITQLNTDPNTNYLGIYSDGGSGVILLSMPTNLVNQFCSNGTLSFVIFSD